MKQQTGGWVAAMLVGSTALAGCHISINGAPGGLTISTNANRHTQRATTPVSTAGATALQIHTENGEITVKPGTGDEAKLTT
jgi:hypothetical protein